MSEKNENDLEVGRAPSQTTSVSKEVTEAATAQIDWTPEEERSLVRRQVPLFNSHPPPLGLSIFLLSYGGSIRKGPPTLPMLAAQG